LLKVIVDKSPQRGLDATEDDRDMAKDRTGETGIDQADAIARLSLL